MDEIKCAICTKPMEEGQHKGWKFRRIGARTIAVCGDTCAARWESRVPELTNKDTDEEE